MSFYDTIMIIMLHVRCMIKDVQFHLMEDIFKACLIGYCQHNAKSSQKSFVDIVTLTEYFAVSHVTLMREYVTHRE